MNFLQDIRFRLGSARHAHRLHSQIALLEERNAALEKSLSSVDSHTGTVSRYEDRVLAENITWIFGTARVGSTWLAKMLATPPEWKMWREPFVGLMVGHLYYERARTWQPENRHFVLGKPEEKWLPHLRELVLDGATAATGLGRGGRVIAKEPNGSIGAPLLMRALPESRIVVLVRDPRDVIASTVDAELGWALKDAPSRSKTSQSVETIVSQRSRKYADYIGRSLEAYEAHDGPKAVVYYEELRTDTNNVLQRLNQELGLGMERRFIEQAIERTEWDSIPEEERGAGKFHRKAQPGSWHEDLTPDHVAMVEENTGNLMDRLGYEREA